MRVEPPDPDMRRATRASCWVAAIVCALALLCLVRWRVQCRRSLEQACLETHRRFLEAVEKGRAEEAYSLMVSDYRRVCTVSDFQRIMGRYAWGEYKRFRCLRMWKQKGRWNCEVGLGTPRASLWAQSISTSSSRASGVSLV